MTRKIEIFDTTLRDGEQSPGASMNTEEKLIVARQLLRLGVDVIEAGFPMSSQGDLRSVQEIGTLVGNKCVVCAFARAVDKDIEVAAWMRRGSAFDTPMMKSPVEGWARTPAKEVIAMFMGTDGMIRFAPAVISARPSAVVARSSPSSIG